MTEPRSKQPHLKHLPATDDAVVQQDRRFFGHPLPLSQLFGLELWERFSYYGMTGVLAIYLYSSIADGGLAMDRPVALAIVGAYGGAVFLATILGSWIADRVLGSERVLLYSAFIIMFGHIALALLTGFGGVAVGLVLIALGSGGLKATASAIVGSLYTDNDPRRDAGFSIFYMGVNVGALLGPFVTGLLQDTIGFHIAFGAAAVGMALGLGIYLTGRKRLPESAQLVPDPIALNRVWLVVLAVLAGVCAIALLWLTGAMNPDNLAWWTAGVSALAAVVYFTVILSNRRVSADEKSRTRSFIAFFLASVVFWALYQQVFSVLTAYSDTRMNRTILGWQAPVAWIALIPAAWVIVLAPFASLLWVKLGERQPSTPVKFGLALLSIGGAYLLFLPFSGAGPNATPVLYVAFVLMLFVVGELMLSPVGLSLATKLSPKVFKAQMIALFYLASAVGTALSGVFAEYYDEANQVPYWTTLGLASIAVGVVILLIAKPLLAMMRGIR
ncbi:MFS transporter [Brevibacterium sp. 5221]|uniref:MFS transporter n=1 Tax=Brevibacterium rongguiense TaxID=2695267 RepID=A0A6N9H5F2_9MICO|nr:oligopeptide:H+ symporter [Brevibacterium rongguiense]MYM19071.1 MFS transporter [Brevibacterium rongguiense]